MASGGLWRSNICPECGVKVEILNNDIQFSMNLHFQSHKSFDTINHEIDQQMKNIRIGPKKSNKWDYSCPECKESVVIVNNDISLSLKLHAQKHKSPQGEGRTEDQSSVTSGKSKGSDNKVKAAVPNPNLQMPPVAPVSILEGVFESMAPGLKMHKGFVSENEKGKVSCDICKVTVDSVFSISDHLKTKSHEDKSITFLTNLLPSELHQAMEFVSFYGSNLCCNLCRGKIDLNSNNPHETIVGILSHNSSKGHLKNKTNDDSNGNTDGAVVILKSLAKLNPIVDNNKHLIECKMEPQFRCKLCDKTIIYDQNESLMYKNFYSHFTSKGHIKCSEASSVLEAFNLSHFPGKERHNLCALRGGIYCTVCHCPVEVNLQQLIDHVKNAPIIGSVPGTIGEHNYQLKNDATLPQEKGAPGNVKQNLRSILGSLPPHLRNTKCIVEDEKGLAKCVTCNMIIPTSTYNIQTHLLGKAHKNKSATVTHTSELTESSVLLLKNLFELVPISLRSHLKFIQAVSKEKVYCSVCNFQVPAHTKCLEEHLEGAAHKTAVENFKLSLAQEMKIPNDPSKGDLLEKLTKSNTISKSLAKYFILNGDHYKCKLCESKITKSNDEKIFKDNIMSHINGQKHKTALNKVYDELLQKLETLNPAIKTDKQFLQKEQGGLYCCLCSCHISASTEFDSFRTNLLSHLTGSNHISKKATFTGAKAASTPTSSPVNQNAIDPMKLEFFKSHPFKDDIAFLKSSSVAGYLSCTLCNTIINPMYLREHLEDVNHIHKKSFVQRSMPLPNASDDPDMARNMETMISLLGNIDKKLSWQNN